MDYRVKDQIKFKDCNKLLSRGIKGSSSFNYSKNGIPACKISHVMVNCGEYTDIDRVGISVNGNRKGAQLVNMAQLKKIIKAGATIVKDNAFNTARSFNTGERHLEKILIKHGYVRTINNNDRSLWLPKPTSINLIPRQLKNNEFKSRRSTDGKSLALNITVKSGIKMFAPTWDMVRGIKTGKLTKQAYTDKYIALMRESFRRHKAAWMELFKFRNISLHCYCKDGSFCHRHLLADLLSIMFTKYNVKSYIQVIE